MSAVKAQRIRSSEAIPPLNSGDRLTRDEFERRYNAMPPQTKAELIEGVVYMSSPVNNDHHGEPHFDLIAWLGYYRTFTPGVKGGDNSTLRLDLDSEPQPDALLRLLPEYGGGAVTDDDGYITSAPELIGEVSASSVSYDLHDKLRVYRRNGVKEYVVWRVYDKQIDWFILQGTDYTKLDLVNGLYKSQIFPGLWLDPAAMVEGDMEKVLSVLQKGIESAEHAAFISGR
jgi:Uma2 family endonuclease